MSRRRTHHEEARSASPLRSRARRLPGRWRRPLAPLSSRLLLTSLLLVLPLPLAAADKNPRFQHLALDDGLSQSTINAVLQDRTGFMWFATEDGLNRYDGASVRVFKHDPEDPSSLSSSWVWALLEDFDGSLWIGTHGGGLNLYDPAAGSLALYRHHPEDPSSLSHDRVRVIHRDRGGVLWIGTDHGLNRYDPETDSFVRYLHDPDDANSLSDDRVLSVHDDRQGHLWIGTWEGGLNRLDPATDSFAVYRADPETPDSLASDHVRSIYQDRNGNLWIGTFGGLHRFDPKSERFVRYRSDPEDPASLPSDRVRAILQDSSGTLWVGTDGGLCAWHSDTDGFAVYRHDASEPRGLSDDRVRVLYQDRGGVLWAGTQQGGLSRFNPLTGSFPHFKSRPAEPAGLSSNSITSFADEGDGTVWIGTLGGGLNRFDTASGRFTHYRHDPDDRASLNDDRVMSLLVDSRDQLWIGTYTGGLNRFDRQTGSFRHFVSDPSDPTSLSANGVMSLLEDLEGNLWVGTFGGGLNLFDRDRSTFVHFRHDPADAATLSSDRVTTLLEDSSRVLWVGTDGGGLNRFDRITGSFSRYRQQALESGGPSNDAILSLHEDPDGDLWIGTRGVGLLQWRHGNRQDGRPVFERFTERDGLPNGWIYGILSDQRGNLWLSTNKGLCKLHPPTRSVKSYNATHGVQSNEFNFGAYHRDADGRLYFGGINGFNAFSPGRIRDNAHVPPVVLTAFRRANQEVDLEGPPWSAERVELGFRDYVVSFDFAVLDYTAPHENRLAYQLQGFDDDWIELGTLRRATFTNLDPGNYTLRVKGSNNDGVWNEEGVSVRVRVVPPPWQTGWSYLLYGLVVGGVGFAYVRAQQRKLEREEEYSRKLEHQVQERTRELEEAALTDALTGLRNRRYLMTHIHEDLALVDRYYRDHRKRIAPGVEAPRDFLFLMIDLDGLKGVNDLYGHAAGDAAILQMRDLLGQACRRSDTLVRLGGDEFLLVGRDVDRLAAESVAERIRETVRHHRFELGDGVELQMSCSIGFAFYPFLPEDPGRVSGEQVVTIADRALYVSKTSGRNAWVGIHATERTAPDDLVEMINYRLEPLVAQGAIELSTSVRQQELVWTRRDQAAAAG